MLMSHLEGLKNKMEIVDREIAVSHEEKKHFTERQLEMLYLSERETYPSDAALCLGV